MEEATDESQHSDEGVSICKQVTKVTDTTMPPPGSLCLSGWARCGKILYSKKNVTEKFSLRNLVPNFFDIPLHKKKIFCITKISEEGRKDHIFITLNIFLFNGNIIWDKLFKSGLSKFCVRQPLIEWKC